jgi:branched-chain amino acid transport system ATP-binding protein
MLLVEGLRAKYGSASALHGVSLEVSEGEICTILGSNGAGKTTLLRCLIGVHRASSGRVKLDGKDITKQSPRGRVKTGIALCPEGRHLFSHLSVQENLDLGGRILADESARKRQLEHVRSLFPILADRAQQQAGTLSGGEQQMCAIGRALMARPRLLMLDEPSLGLSPKMCRLVFATLQKINAEGTSVLLVEQNAGAALEIAHRAYVLRLGHVALTGLAAELRDHPQVREAYLGTTVEVSVDDKEQVAVQEGKDQ